jgi:FMN phosphatase YigB (HAD superfamily)
LAIGAAVGRSGDKGACTCAALRGSPARVFDAYGALFDFASVAAACKAAPVERRAALTALWRDKHLQYAWLRSLQGRYVDFWTVTGDALDSLGLAASEVAFLSSNGWDAYAASDFGLGAVWCNRYRQPRERLPGAPDFEIANLAELPPLLGIG